MALKALHYLCKICLLFFKARCSRLFADDALRMRCMQENKAIDIQWPQVFMPLGLIFCVQCNDTDQKCPFSATICCAFILFDNAFAVPVIICLSLSLSNQC